ncbi:MAG: hypothetical protein KDD25_04110 [Bdellovibrionales bacterium]|nr:hypothetical protein [Bdellovibrionales bacterium]
MRTLLLALGLLIPIDSFAGDIVFDYPIDDINFISDQVGRQAFNDYYLIFPNDSHEAYLTFNVDKLEYTFSLSDGRIRYGSLTTAEMNKVIDLSMATSSQCPMSFVLDGGTFKIKKIIQPCHPMKKYESK